MRIRFTERQVLALTYLLLVVLFVRAQQATGPYEQALRARVGQSTGPQVLVTK